VRLLLLQGVESEGIEILLKGPSLRGEGIALECLRFSA
jgi:hypothetical protein